MTNQELTNFDLVSQSFILCGLFYKKIENEYNNFNVISIIDTPLFLIEKSKLTHPFFLKSQQVIVTN